MSDPAPAGLLNLRQTGRWSAFLPRQHPAAAQAHHARSDARYAADEYVHSGSDEGDLSDSPAVSLVVENYRPVQVLLAAD